MFLETFSVQIGLCWNFLTSWEVCKAGVRSFSRLWQITATCLVATARGETPHAQTRLKLRPLRPSCKLEGGFIKQI